MIERKYYKDDKEIKYLENVDLKSKGNKFFTHITSSYDGQIILAIDKEGKITLWSKHDYEEDDDEEYYENSQLAKIFNERGQAFTYACFSPSRQKNFIVTELKDKKRISIMES